MTHRLPNFTFLLLVALDFTHKRVLFSYELPFSTLLHNSIKFYSEKVRKSHTCQDCSKFSLCKLKSVHLMRN